MKILKLKSLGLVAICGLALVASSATAEDTSNDELTRRTERALFKMSQVDTGNKKVRVLTPAKPVVANAPLVDPPAEMDDDQPAAPMPSAGAPRHQPTLIDNCSCNTECCEPCCDCLCGPPQKCWVRADILGWWTKGMHVPPLATSGPDANNPGVLGEPGTEILYGNGDILERARVGGRIAVGTWLDDCHKWGLEGDYFALQDLTDRFVANDADYEFLSRPFIDVTNGLPGDPAVEGVGNDNLCGVLTINAKTSLQGAGLNVRRNLWCCTECCDHGGSNPCNPSDWSSWCCRVDGLAGYRFYRLDDSLTIREQLEVVDKGNGPPPGGQVALGTRFDITDSFQTTNEFQGGDLGLVGTMYRGKWSIEVLAKVGLGNNQSTVRIDGSTTTVVPGQAPNTLPGGLLALPSNIGTYTRNDFVAIPQIGINLGYQLNCHWRVYTGYNFLYWANVVRAGDQVDLRVDTNQLPPGQQGNYPAFAFRDTTFWAQGINGGLEYRW